MSDKQQRPSVQPTLSKAPDEEAEHEPTGRDNSDVLAGMGSGDALAAATDDPPDPLPHLAALEKSFGRSLSDMRAYTGRKQILGLNAKALAKGSDTLVFAEEDPSLEVVAEEVAHALQPSSGGQGVSDPNDPSEDEAKGVAARVARGEQVDEDELHTPGAEVQRFWVVASLGAYLWGHDAISEDTEGEFEWEDAKEAAPSLPTPTLVQHWSGPAYTYTDDQSVAYVEAMRALGETKELFPPDTYKGLPLRLDSEHALSLEQADARMDALAARFVAPLDSAPTVADAIADLDAVRSEVRADDELAELLPVLQGDARIFQHARMTEIARVNPAWLVGFAEAFDPLPLLKALLRAKGPDDPGFWDELKAWSGRYPEAAASATADPEVVELITRAGTVLGNAETSLEAEDDRVDLDQSMIASQMDGSANDVVPGAALMGSHIHEGNVKIGDAIVGGLADMTSDESADQLRILQILMNGGADQEGTRPALEQALSERDSAAFVKTWHQVVQSADELATYRKDVMFLVRVEQRLGAGMAERVRIDLASGADAGKEDELSDGEREKIRSLSNKTAGALSELIGKTAWGWGADDTVVMGLVRGWGDAVRAELQDEAGKVHPKRRLQAQAILHRIFEDLSGKDLSDRLAAHISSGPFKEAEGIVGSQGEIRSADALSTDTVPQHVAANTLGTASRLAGEIGGVAYMYGANDKKVLGMIRDWRAVVDDAIDKNADVPDLKVQCQSMLHDAFEQASNKALGDRLAAHLSADNASEAARLVGTALELRAAKAQADGGAAGGYTLEISPAERELVDTITRKAASELRSEFTEVWVDDADVLTKLQTMQSELRTALMPADKSGENMVIFHQKVQAASREINTAFAAYGNLEEELADHVWDADIRRRCQMISGTRDLPIDPNVSAQILEEQLGLAEEARDKEEEEGGGTWLDHAPTPEEVERGLGRAQDQIVELAAKLDAVLRDSPNNDRVVSKVIDELAEIGEGKDGVGLSDAQRTALLESAFLSFGGDLTLTIQTNVSDPAKADEYCKDLGLEEAAIARTEQDAEMADLLDQVEQGNAMGGFLVREYGSGQELSDEDLADLPSQEELDKSEAQARTLKDQLRAMQKLGFYAVKLFDAIEGARQIKPSAAKALLKAKAKPIAGVAERDDHPLVLSEGSVVEDLSDTLLERQYRKSLGIPLGRHLGQLDDSLRSAVLNNIGMEIQDVAAPFVTEIETDDKGQIDSDQPEVMQLAYVLGADIDELDVQPGFDGEQAVQNAVSLRQLLVATRNAVRGEPYTEPSGLDNAKWWGRIVVGIVSMGSTEAIIAGASNSHETQMRTELHMAIADLLGTKDEARVVRRAYQDLYGVSIAYELRAIFGADSAEAETLTRRAERTPATYVMEITALAAAKKTDEIYASLFEASAEDKQAVLDDPKALNTLRSLGKKPYDRIYLTLQDKLTLKDMMRSRDGDSDDYDYVLTEMWGKSKRKLGFGEDVEKMEADVALFLSVWKNKALEALPDAGDDEAVKKAQTEQVDEQFRSYCREILDDADLRAVFENSLSEKERMKMMLLIGDGGELSATNQVMVDVHGFGTDGDILEHIKAMSDDERAAAIKDPSFMLRVMHDLHGDDRKKALGYLHGKQGLDSLADAETTLGDQGLLGVDENAAMTDILSLDQESLTELSKDSVRIAKLTKQLGGEGSELPTDKIYDDQAQLFSALMAEMRDLEEHEGEHEAEANARDLANAGDVDEAGQKAITDRNAAIFDKRAWLKTKHTFALLNASFGGAEGLVDAATAAFAERGEMSDPANPDVKLYVWTQSDREALWAEVEPQILDRWKGQSIDTLTNLKESTASGGLKLLPAWGLGAATLAFLTGGLVLGGLAAYGLGDRADDMDGKTLSGTWDQVVKDAVLGVADPTIIKIAKQQEFSRDDEGIEGSIASAGSQLVIEDWSNIERKGTDGRSLREAFDHMLEARTEYEACSESMPDNPGQAEQDRLHELDRAAKIALHEYRHFGVDMSEEVATFLSDRNDLLAEYLSGASDAQMLSYREAVLERIFALSSEEIAVHFGLGHWAEDELTGVRTFERAGSMVDPSIADGKTATITDDDISSLMNESRKQRARFKLAQAQTTHQTDGFSLVDTYSSGKEKIGDSYADYAIDYYDAIGRTDEEKAKGEVADITDEEAKGLDEKLAALGSSITEYKAEKTKLANRLKMVVATVLSVVTALVSGPGGPTLIASLLLAGGEAVANVAIDELCQGNDFDGLKEIGPAVLKAVGEELLTHGMGNAFDAAAKKWPVGAATLKDNPFITFANDVREGVQSTALGKLAWDVAGKGVVNPTLDAVTAPLLHLMDPNALKWGTVSASQEAQQMFDANMANLPHEVWVKTMAALKDGSKELLLNTLLKDEEGTGDLPGVKVDEKKAPKAPDLWASFTKARGKKWKELKESLTDPVEFLTNSETLKKELVTYLVESGAILVDKALIESGNAELASTDGSLMTQLESSKAGTFVSSVDGFMKIVEERPDVSAGDVFDVLYPHFSDVLVGTVEGYADARNKHRAHQVFERTKGKLKDQVSDLPEGMDHEQLEAFYEHYLQNDAVGADLTDAELMSFVQGEWPGMRARLSVAEQTIDDDGDRTAYLAWVLEDPESFDERCTKQTLFLRHREQGERQIWKQKAALADIPVHQRDWAVAMLEQDDGALFDFTTGELSVPDLTTTKGKKSFDASWVKMKQDAVVGSGNWNDEAAAELKKKVKTMSSVSDWERFPFGPNDSDAAEKVADILLAEIEAAKPKKKVTPMHARDPKDFANHGSE